MLSITVPTYYGALSLQAFLRIKSGFKEEKHQWIEYPIHLFAWCVPLAFSTVFALTENFNPSGSGCYVEKAPKGCQSDPDVPCQRGKDVDMVESIVGFGIISLYFVFPPSVMIALYCWIKRIQKKVEGSMGMQQIREDARRQMMQHIAIQIFLYLFSFWLTVLPGLISVAYQILYRTTLPNLQMFANCVYSLQGFIITIVYFVLQRFGTPNVERVTSSTPGHRGRQLTVLDVRSNAAKAAKSDSEVLNGRRESAIRCESIFNIFDGVPDEDSPWAKYIHQEDEHANNVDAPYEGESLPN